MTTAASTAARCNCDTPSEPGVPHRSWCATQHQHPGPNCPGVCEPTEPAAELTWDDVWAAIGREVWKLAPQDHQDAGHRDICFTTCWQNIMYAVEQGIHAAAGLPDEDQP